jgi:glycosyltransferase involved in cell wall biosynthesis
MKANPMASIIINNFNYSRFLAESIDSALNQTYSFTEVIVVDDGSTDASRDIIASYGNKIISVLKENGGQASSLNEGFEISTGKIVFFLDSDDLFYPEKVEKTISYLFETDSMDSPVIFHNLFETIDENGLSLNINMAEYILALQDREIKALSKIIRGFDKNYFFREEINEVSFPDQLREFAFKYRYIPYLGMPTSSISVSRVMANKLFPLPVDGYKISADELIVKAGSLLGKVYSSNISLTKYRCHGSNHWYGKTMKKEVEELAGIQRDKYLNSKLGLTVANPIFSFLDSMQADGFYRFHFGNKAASYLFALSFNVVRWHLNSITLLFFLETFVRGIRCKISGFLFQSESV